MRKVLVVLLILVIGLVVAVDRIGVRIAENEIANQVAAQYALPQRPDVQIHGFPFLTQAVGGEYQQVDVAIGDWTQEGVTVRDVTVQMRGIGAALGDITSGNVDNITVQTATASALIPYEVLRQRAPEQVKKIQSKGDDLQVDLGGRLLGVPLSGTAVVSVRATAKGIAVTPVSVSPSGSGVPIPLSLVRSRLTWNVPLTNLPVGSRISEIRPTGDGLRVTATAGNLSMGNLNGNR
ncbi:hypothetical protein Acsp03_48520 [Actinomadura sp. NBRC 104412]|uniref:LmeA family phospholipid-binding protein n=1 Tax=Actinomadura sp. NBRC 104412 TaxID=3032203 RepID=UPI0024A06281|nr:DUF2993 domain-containing protein [Actinomadura sp. NBRC 104412]GLZ07386.1 hypothetical protein Acsp03_48520 [Actinomadura sp. NBRC 104412]